jgi:nicotinamidase-related amidase
MSRSGVSGAGSALLVIDVQQQPLSELTSSERRTEFLGVLASLIEQARERGLPVVYVRHSDDWTNAHASGGRRGGRAHRSRGRRRLAALARGCLAGRRFASRSLTKRSLASRRLH